VLAALDWNAAVTGAAAIFEAVVGAGALVLVSHFDRKERRRTERDAALSSLFAAANQLGLIFAAWSEIAPN
jgi:hypothetical protein